MIKGKIIEEKAENLGFLKGEDVERENRLVIRGMIGLI